MSNRKTTIIVVLWSMGIMALLLAAGVNQLTAFDPDMRLAQAASQTDFDSTFVTELASAGVTPGTLVHIQGNGRCYCNKLSQPHQQALSDSLKQEGYHLQELSLATHPALTRYISHYPALAIIDEQGNLRYLGPYAIGYGCFTGTNLLTQIRRIASSSEYFGASINSDARGCFCAA